MCRGASFFATSVPGGAIHVRCCSFTLIRVTLSNAPAPARARAVLTGDSPDKMQLQSLGSARPPSRCCIRSETHPRLLRVPQTQFYPDVGKLRERLSSLSSSLAYEWPLACENQTTCDRTQFVRVLCFACLGVFVYLYVCSMRLTMCVCWVSTCASMYSASRILPRMLVACLASRFRPISASASHLVSAVVCLVCLLSCVCVWVFVCATTTPFLCQCRRNGPSPPPLIHGCRSLGEKNRPCWSCMTTSEVFRGMPSMSLR